MMETTRWYHHPVVQTGGAWHGPAKVQYITPFRHRRGARGQNGRRLRHIYAKSYSRESTPYIHTPPENDFKVNGIITITGTCTVECGILYRTYPPLPLIYLLHRTGGCGYKTIVIYYCTTGKSDVLLIGRRRRS